MSQFNEVPEPIICNPYEEPAEHWYIAEGEPCVRVPERRKAVYYYRPPGRASGAGPASEIGEMRQLILVNQLRERVKAWREAGYPGASRTSTELLQYWRREGRQHRLFFCQIEAAETIIFLVEGRADMRQGIDIPLDDPSDESKAQGYNGFLRYAAKMATGTGKTTVMGLLASWSILNKTSDRSDARYSDVILVVCPNVTIRDRLQELDPRRGEASLYRTRDLVPPHMMPKMTEGHVIITNWHPLEPQAGNQVGGVGGKVVQKGEESDTALVKRILGDAAGNKRNILIFNDEAHHAYRLRYEPTNPEDVDGEDADEEDEEERREATVWVNGLDKVSRVAGINLCIDLSATPYYLNRTGNEANTPFPWIVSDFGLVDAIESGLVKIPQLPVRDTTGEEIPAYFNVWRWILPKLTTGERGGKKTQPKAEAILKWAHTPIAQLAGLWSATFAEWKSQLDIHPTPPVFIVVCRNTKLAKVLYEWIADDVCPREIPSMNVREFRNKDGQINTIRVDSKVVHETDTEGSKDLEKRKLRFVLDTVGRTRWPNDQPPAGWVEIAEKLGLPVGVPPGRDVRCIVSVAMLTEGWDCTTVTHIVGLRPFMSQLLCEQVVGRGLRRTIYRPDESGLFPEEVAKVYGVPFEIIPYKTNKTGPVEPPPKIYHVHAISPQKDAFEIRFPRVEAYSFGIRNRVRVDWESIPSLTLDPNAIPPEVEVKGLNVNNKGRLSLSGPGKHDEVTLREWRSAHRLQELEFQMARALTRDYAAMPQCEVPVQALFDQMLAVIKQFLSTKIRVLPGQDLKDVFLSPYYGWAVEILTQAIRPDTDGGEAPELPVYEKNRPSGSTRDVDFWTSREVREVTKSHLNYVVADTKKWEQSVAFYLDKSAHVSAFAKNSGLGFAIQYLHNGQMHDYVPDYIVRVQDNGQILGHLILEVKGYDPLREIKAAAAIRWIHAVNADGSHGRWTNAVVDEPTKASASVAAAAASLLS